MRVRATGWNLVMTQNTETAAPAPTRTRIPFAVPGWWKTKFMVFMYGALTATLVLYAASVIAEARALRG